MKKILLPILLITAISLTLKKPEKTIANLQKAYEAEANASRRYDLFAHKASEQGYDQIAKLFRAISKSESIHMKNHQEALSKLGQEAPKITLETPNIKNTKENLRLPIQGEQEETENLYPKFIEETKKEKAESAVKSFTYAMNAELQHEKLLKEALNEFGKNKKMDYYVSSLTGETLALSPTSPTPNPKTEGEKFIKIE